MLLAGGAGDNLRDNADDMVDLTETSPKPLVEHVNLEPEELELLFWEHPVRDFSGMSRVNIGFWKTIATNLSTVFWSMFSGIRRVSATSLDFPARTCEGPVPDQHAGDGLVIWEEW
jgi:hypothetical protein